MSFWVMAGLISFAVGVYLLRALARGLPSKAEGGGAGAKALALYRAQLGEIDRDLARDVIAPPEAERLRTEVQRRILDLARQSTPPEKGLVATRLSERFGFAAVILAVLTAGAMYIWLGAPDYPDLPLTKRLALAEKAYAARPTQAEAEAGAPKSPEIAAEPEFMALIEQLRAAVKARPRDVQGLTLLARNEALLGNFAPSARAYEALLAQKGDSATAADYLGAAQAMIAAANGTVTREAEAALMNTLRLDPANGLARYFSGLMFAQVGRPDRAFALWEPLLRESPADAPWMPPIQTLLPDVAADAGIRFEMPDAVGPDAAQIAGAAAMSEADRTAMISSMVDGLETRLTATGGSGAEWARLITSLGVLGETARAKAAFASAKAALAADPAALQSVEAAAQAAGLTP